MDALSRPLKPISGRTPFPKGLLGAGCPSPTPSLGTSFSLAVQNCPIPDRLPHQSTNQPVRFGEVRGARPTWLLSGRVPDRCSTLVGEGWPGIWDFWRPLPSLLWPRAQSRPCSKPPAWWAGERQETCRGVSRPSEPVQPSWSEWESPGGVGCCRNSQGGGMGRTQVSVLLPAWAT